VRRPLLLTACAGALLLALYSCSMHAEVTTDDRGQVVDVSSLRLESSLSRVGIAMLVAGGNVALEVRWDGCLVASSGAQLHG
jgi:hypothetical protein